MGVFWKNMCGAGMGPSGAGSDGGSWCNRAGQVDESGFVSVAEGQQGVARRLAKKEVAENRADVAVHRVKQRARRPQDDFVEGSYLANWLVAV